MNSSKGGFSPGRNYSEKYKLAVTEEWIRGWDSCYFAAQVDEQPSEPAARLEYQPGSLTEEEIAGGADIPNCLRCGRTLFGGHSHDSRWYCSSETKAESPPSQEGKP